MQNKISHAYTNSSNANGLKTHRDELLTSEKKIDIALISETHITMFSTFHAFAYIIPITQTALLTQVLLFMSDRLSHRSYSLSTKLTTYSHAQCL